MGHNDQILTDGKAILAKKYKKSLEYIARTGLASREVLQREIPLLYQEAEYFIDTFASDGYISSGKSGKPREVYISYEDYLKLYPQDKREKNKKPNP